MGKEKSISGFSFVGFCYGYFSWLGTPILKIFRSIKNDLEAAGVRLYAEAYASIIGFFLFISIILSLSGIPFLILREVFGVPLLGRFPYSVFIAFLFLPVLVLALGVIIPKILLYNRASSLDSEVAYAAAYISAMSTGGISPFVSIQRLRNVDLLPQLSKAAKKMAVDVEVMGMDPVTSIEKSARSLPSSEYKDLLLGYASTLRTGGDVVHYLLRKTESIFRNRLAKIKAIGERMGIMLEIYVAISVIGALGIYIMFSLSQTLRGFLPTALFSSGAFFMFSYIALPALSLMFLYIADVMQPKYPTVDWRPYKVFLACTPAMIYLLLGMFFSFLLPPYVLRYNAAFKPLADLVEYLTIRVMRLDPGFNAAVGGSLALILGTLPAAVADTVIAMHTRGIEKGMTSFLRDLVEVRKSGTSPERSIQYLASRDYGPLTKYLQIMGKQLGWGVPLRKVYETFQKKVKSWVARITMYLLVEAIDIGGGGVETLETMASFGEMIESVEREKEMTLRPLLLIPYIGTIVFVASVMVLMSFTQSTLAVAKMSIALTPVIQLLTTPLVFHVFLVGLVAGKIGGSRVSNGFKHAIILLIITIIGFVMTPHITVTFQL